MIWRALALIPEFLLTIAFFGAIAWGLVVLSALIAP